GHGAQRAAAALQRSIRGQYRYRNVQSHRAAERLRGERAGDDHDPANDGDAAAIGERMSITGPGSVTAANLVAQTNMFSQLNKLSLQLGTGEASQTYAGLGAQAGVALSLGSQLAALGGYSTTATTVSTTLTLAQSVLTELDNAGSAVK